SLPAWRPNVQLRGRLLARPAPRAPRDPKLFCERLSPVARQGRTSNRWLVRIGALFSGRVARNWSNPAPAKLESSLPCQLQFCFGKAFFRPNTGSRAAAETAPGWLNLPPHGAQTLCLQGKSRSESRK